LPWGDPGTAARSRDRFLGRLAGGDAFTARRENAILLDAVDPDGAILTVDGRIAAVAGHDSK
jgi:hypothetical protein